MALVFNMICLILSMMLPVTMARIWTLQLGYDYGGWEYWGEDGRHTGVARDLIDFVCEEGGIDCRIVLNSHNTCWQANPDGTPGSGGPALMSRWVDGCVGYLVTIPRTAVFRFSRSFLKEPDQNFYTLKGKSGNFNALDMAGKMIGFRRSGSGDPSCIARQDNIKNNILSSDQLILAGTRDELFQALKSGRADAVFGSENIWTDAHLPEIEKVYPTFICSLSGNSVMARKDSAVIAEWNVAFNKLTNTNKFEKFCRESVPKHAHKNIVKCLAWHPPKDS